MHSHWWKYLAALMTAALAVILTTAAVSAEPRPGSTPNPTPHQNVAAAVSERCGGTRLPVKTGTDPDVGGIDLQAITPTTIAALTTLPAPRTLPANNRLRPTETTVFRLSATLQRYALVPADSDYHLILADNAGHTMIAEIPAPACVAASPLKASITHARATFDARYTPTSSLRDANVPVTVTGVGFFDSLHGQAGVAPNGIELHPVLDVRFGTATGGSTTSQRP